MIMPSRLICLVMLVGSASCASCDEEKQWQCSAVQEPPKFLHEIGCASDCDRLASAPTDASSAGARSVKTVIDRYDNNIRYINDELERLYAKLNPEDIVVFFSDHGEEFWDHGGFEHGHTVAGGDSVVHQFHNMAVSDVAAMHHVRAN